MTENRAFLLTTVAVCAVGALFDARTGRIPNWLTLPLLSVAPVSHALSAFYRQGGSRAVLVAFGISLLGAVGSAFLPLLLLHAGGLGMGDVKLFAAIGAACGTLVGLYAQTYAYVVAMLYAVVLLAYRGKLSTTIANMKTMFALPSKAPARRAESRHPTFTEMHFGPAILAGMCVAAWAFWGEG
jgi:prepilin peptidase CpaA